MTRGALTELRAGDEALLSGDLIAARDAAHRLFAETLSRGGALPFDIKNAVIYYCGPTPAPNGRAIGSAGPTTSSRMDAYTPALLRLGLAGMIGKGARSAEVAAAICETGGVYFAAPGGAGAYLAECVKHTEVIAYPELGTEAVRLLTVERFPVVAALDAHGGNLYELGPRRYLSGL